MAKPPHEARPALEARPAPPARAARLVRPGCVLALLTLAACTDDTADFGSFPAAEPVAAEIPQQLECPAEWQPRQVSGASVCSPEPLGAPSDSHWPCPEGWIDQSIAGVADGAPGGCEPVLLECGTGQRLALERGECVPVGGDCAGRNLPANLPDDRRVWYVAPGAVGTGEAGLPLGTIAAAVAAASAGDVIALAPGDYAEAVEIDKSLSLWGSCPATTRITAGSFDHPDPEVISVGRGVLTIAGGDLDLRDLAIGGEREGIVITAGSLTARGLWLEGTMRRGIHARGAALDLGDVLIERTRHPQGEEVVRGRGLQLETDTRLVMGDAEVRGAVDAGVWARGSDVELSNTLIRDVLIHGLFAQDAQLSADRLVVARVFDSGVRVGGPETRATLADLVVREVNPTRASNFTGLAVAVGLGAALNLQRARLVDLTGHGLFVDAASVTGSQLVVERASRGIEARGGAVLQLSEVRMSAMTSLGVLASDPDTRVELSDLRFLGDAAAPEVIGALAAEGAHLALSAAELSQAFAGVLASHDGSQVVLSDVRIERIVGQRDFNADGAPLAVSITEGASLDARRTLVSGATDFGFLIWEATASLEDIWVEGVRASRPEYRAIGIGVDGDSDVRGARWTLGGVHGHGVLVQGTGELSITDILVRDASGPTTADNVDLALGLNILNRAMEDTLGVGIGVGTTGPVELERVLVSDVQGVGMAIGLSKQVAVRDLIVERTMPHGLIRGEAEPAGGVALGVFEGAVVELERVELLDNHAVGLLTSDAEVNLRSAIIADVGTGALLGDLVAWRTDDLADCIQAAGGAQLTLEGVDLSSCNRAGLLLHDSQAAIVSINLNGTRLISQGVQRQDDPQLAALAETPEQPLPISRLAPEQLTENSDFGNLLRAE